MKKYLIIVVILLAVLLAFDYLYFYSGTCLLPSNDPISCISSVENSRLYLQENGTFRELEIRGVNLGLSKPGHYATDLAITKEEYLHWFRQIQDLGANVIRVYTAAGPAFYQALYEFNTQNPTPLYLLHGVGIDEYMLNSRHSVYDEEFYRPFQKSCKNIVDIIHGRFKQRGENHLIPYHYKWDVSPWVYGYIIGADWNNDLVVYTNDCFPQKEQFRGKYLHTENANNFEIFLAEMGNEMISYETRKYASQHAVSFVNWPITCPLELDERVRQVAHAYGAFDIEHICTSEKFQGGMFASYHVFPFAPEYVLYDNNFLDNANSYVEFLRLLTAHHTLPVVVAEFGVPSSRGMASYEENRALGRDQGMLNEQQQGQALVSIYEDIRAAGCSGGIAYLWQDEWYKRTWNTIAAVDLEHNIYWSDAQSADQHYGLLAFDPGNPESACCADGDQSEWTEEDIVASDSHCTISVKYDLAGLYLMLSKEDLDLENERLFIPLDITPESGSEVSNNPPVTASDPMDFIIDINGKAHSRVWVHSRYNSSMALYGAQLQQNFNRFVHPEPDSPVFDSVSMLLQEKTYYFQGYIVPLQQYIFNDLIDYYSLNKSYETGKLRYGNGNPESEDFDSLADFCAGDGFVEIRIPWQLLNFADPSNMKIHDDYYIKHGVEYLRIDHISVGAGDGSQTIELHEFPLKPLGKKPEYHERLKKSYYILQDYWQSHP